MRNIARVILWGLPPTFCSLVQRAGRAGRDLTTQGEAILIVPPGVLKDGSTRKEQDVVMSVENAAVEQEALNREPEEPDLINVAESLDDEGIRLRGVDASESEDEAPVAKLTKKQGKKKERKDTHIREVRALYDFACTTGCRRIPWDNFFENSKKCECRYN